MLSHFNVRTSSNSADVSPRWRATQGYRPNISPFIRFSLGRGHDTKKQSRQSADTTHTRDRQPAADLITQMTTLGCLLSTVALLGCCLLAGVIGLAIAGVVVVAIALSVGRTLVRLKLCELPTDIDGAWPNESGRTRRRVRRDDSGERPSTASFWTALSPAERQAFMSMAHERSFAGGAILFSQGERADHVILIRSGWTKICVDEEGTERIIAERGPGQLVGERAALQVNLRSASVIALETVRTLVVSTEDFAEFVGDHPRVLGIVEGQVYERLTRPSDGCSDTSCHDRSPTAETAQASPAASCSEPFHGENCTIVFTDVAGFGAHARNDEDRRIVRQELFMMIRAAFDDARIPWESCHWDDRGDGLLIVVPPRISTVAVLAGIPVRLSDALKRHNRRSSDAVRIQLRVAVHVGPVVTDMMGLSGEAIISAARLLDAPILKRAIAETAAHLGIIVSTFVYESVIKHSDSDGFRHVRVNVKESRLDAWMQLIGGALTS
jgi:CRP-like cAMP-binding protein